MDLLDHIAARLRDLRVSYNNGEGLSQESLANHLKVAPNTISRWETGTYRPSLKDLERISRFFGVSMTSFLPDEMIDEDEGLPWRALGRVPHARRDGALDRSRNHSIRRRLAPESR